MITPALADDGLPAHPHALTSLSYTRFTDASGRDVEEWIIGDNIFVTVEDADENRNPAASDVIEGALTVENLDSGQALIVRLREVTPNSGVFLSDPIATSPAHEAGDREEGRLELVIGDRLRAIYIDPDDPTDFSEDQAEVTGICDVIYKFGNRPNPLTTVTKFFAFSNCPRFRWIKVEIYDLSGRRVLVLEGEGASLVWDGTNREGSRLANGVYLYIITGFFKDGQPRQSKVHKLVIV